MDWKKTIKPPAPIPDLSKPQPLRHMNFIDKEDEKNFEPVDFVRRPGYNQTGKEISVGVNVYSIAQFPNKTVYQYDVGYFMIIRTLPLWIFTYEKCR